MASFSPYANLILYNETDDKLVRFLDFRIKIAGPSNDSNFMKIDSILDNQNTAIENIENSIDDFIEKTGSVDIIGELSPLNDSSVDLGNSDHRWLNIYATSINGTLNNSLSINGNIYNNSESKNIEITPTSIGAIPLIGSNKISGDLIPSINNANNIGSSEFKFGNIYSENFTGNLKGRADTATSANTATNAPNYLPLAGGTMSGAIAFWKSGWPNAFKIYGGYEPQTGDGIFWNPGNGIIYVRAQNGLNYNGTMNSIAYRIHRNSRTAVFGLYDDYNGALINTDAGLYILNLNGSAYVPVYASLFSQQSSEKYKKNIHDLSSDKAISFLQRINPVEYDQKSDNKHGYGFIAEEVEKVDKTNVTFDKDGKPDGLNYSGFIALLWKIVQMQQAQIDNLQTRLSTLENEREVQNDTL